MLSSYQVLHTSIYSEEKKCWHPTKDPVAKSVEAYSYAKFVIETGKKHQIRLHCQHALQTPIFGDDRYGFEEAKHAKLLLAQDLSKRRSLDFSKTIFLHAGQLEVPTEPGSKERQVFTAKLKKPMERILDHLHIPSGLI